MTLLRYSIHSSKEGLSSTNGFWHPHFWSVKVYKGSYIAITNTGLTLIILRVSISLCIFHTKTCNTECSNTEKMISVTSFLSALIFLIFEMSIILKGMPVLQENSYMECRRTRVKSKVNLACASSDQETRWFTL